MAGLTPNFSNFETSGRTHDPGLTRNFSNFLKSWVVTVTRDIMAGLTRDFSNFKKLGRGYDLLSDFVK